MRSPPGGEDDEYYWSGLSASERVEKLESLKLPASMPVRVDVISPTFFSLREHAGVLTSNIKRLQAASAVVMNVLIHDVKRAVIDEVGAEVAEADYLRHVDEFATLANRKQLPLLWVAGPAYHSKQVPEKYRAAQATDRMHRLNAQAISHVRERMPDARFMDVFHFSQSCPWANCTWDGGHMMRPFNRMKAQVLLNFLCESSPAA